MKHLYIFPAFLTTGGGISAAGIVNTSSDPSTIKNNSTLTSTTQAQELSTKNISEIAKISELKTQNAIQEIEVVNVDNFVPAETQLTQHYSSKIYVSDTSSDIITNTNSSEHKQKQLSEIFKEQIKLSKTKKVYQDVQTHVNTTPPTTSTWEIKTENSVCKIKKKTASSGSPTVPPSVDTCSYGWNIILIDVNDKIKQLLSEETPTPEDITTRFNNLVT